MRKGIIVLVAAFAAVLSVHAAGGPTLSANDYAEIHGLYARYVWAFDSSDGDMFASVFTDDGEFVTGTRTTKGRKDLVAMASRGPKKDHPKIFHITTNVLITPSAEGAIGHAYVVLVDLAKNPAISGGGVYDDVIVRTAQGWKFKRRSYFPEPGPPATTQSQVR
jgi:actinorhodin biosynthesis protein ActVIA